MFNENLNGMDGEGFELRFLSELRVCPNVYAADDGVERDQATHQTQKNASWPIRDSVSDTMRNLAELIRILKGLEKPKIYTLYREQISYKRGK